MARFTGVPAVFVGGVIGSALRLGVSEWLATLPALLAVNLTGSLLLGIVVGRRMRSGHPGGWAVDFAGIGVLGSFTTFSAFAVATLEETALVAAAFVFGSVAAGLFLARLGLAAAGRP